MFGMRLRTSETEIKHLLVAWLAISLAFTIIFERTLRHQFVLTFLISALTVGLGFVLHELAHKIVAQRYGSWSEFRAEPLMLLFAILMAFAGFVFAAPGAVVIFNPYLTREQSGKIAVAGPLTNVALSFAFLELSLLAKFIFPVHSTLGVVNALVFASQIGEIGSKINGWLALFNMIPFGFFDGRKVFVWSRQAFAFATCSAILALLLSHLL
ncbi:MAG: hypothetical protein OCU16_06860 [Candidatus Methanospirare jalkutatii]|nr:hypothetical protein [Candidatus Methanospirare jalkutatii]